MKETNKKSQTPVVDFNEYKKKQDEAVFNYNGDLDTDSIDEDELVESCLNMVMHVIDNILPENNINPDDVVEIIEDYLDEEDDIEADEIKVNITRPLTLMELNLVSFFVSELAFDEQMYRLVQEDGKFALNVENCEDIRIIGEMDENGFITIV